MRYLLGAVARRAVEDDEKVMIGVSLGELLQEYLKASLIHPWQLHAEALSTPRLQRRVQVGPFVGAFDDIRWTEPKRAVASAMPVDQSEARLVESQYL
jgi:hypothetical protein